MQEKEDIIRNLQARNEVLSRQIISLLQSRQFLNGEPSAIGEYKERLADFIWRVSGRSEDDDLYQQLAEEFLIELKADRVSIMVMGSGSTNMAVSQQACSELGTWVPTPYFISFETNDPYKLFLDEVASTDSVCNREWPQDVFEHPNVSLRAACARRVQLEYGGDWIVCLQWVNAPPNWTHKEESLFVELTDYAALVIEQAQLASSIKELRDQNESLIQSMPSAIIGLDFLGNVTFWGGKAEEFFGYSEEEMLGREFSALLPDFAGLVRHIAGVAQQDEELVLDSVLYQSPSGKQRHLQPHLFSMFSNNRGEIALRIDDITKQIDLQQQLLHAQKMETVGTIAGGLAHDFNNLLSGITASATLMHHRWKKNGNADQSDMRELETLIHCAHKATELANRLLVFSRKRGQESKPVLLTECVNNVLALCKSSFERSIRLVTAFSCSNCVVKGVKSQLENMILNLCLNARDAMPQGGTLTIGIMEYTPSQDFLRKHNIVEQHQYYTITIQDTGEGIQNEIMDEIFKPFFTTKEQTGTGLGLAIVEKILEEHGGFIEVHSQKNEGTIFSLFLPQWAHLWEQETPAMDDFEQNAYKILVVDDEETVRNATMRILGEIGYGVEGVCDGTAAIKNIDEGCYYDLVLLDVDMPGLNGLDVYKIIHRLRPKIKILFFTGRGEEYDFSTILADGHAGLIEKPFTFDQLEAAVAGLIYSTATK